MGLAERSTDDSKEFGGFFSSAKGFALLPGDQVVPGDVRGYHIDFKLKARLPGWPPPWIGGATADVHVSVLQWGLGSYERYLAGEGLEWLAWAQEVGEHVLAAQRPDGAWPHSKSYHHTYVLPAGWLSAMAQGEGASLLVRLYRETGDERYADAARRALDAFDVPSEQGGVLAVLDGGPFPEEYPTTPPSFVLNGAIFAIWGLYDVWHGLGDEGARERYEAQIDTLARTIHRWDLGFWSRYDLYPHPIPNVASSSYHLLHMSQLEALLKIAPRAEFERMLERFRGYERAGLNGRRAFAQKALFRLLVPRTKRVARLMPWSPFFRTAS